MNLLQITTNYAPRGASSAIRTSNISKYLSQLGVMVHVITYDVDTLLLFSPADDFLSQKVQGATSVTRLPGGFLRRTILKTTSSRAKANSLKTDGPVRAASSILVPDPHIDALLKFYRRSRTILKETNADVILTHGYPFTMHIVGYLLKIKNPRVRWIADYGDPWTKKTCLWGDFTVPDQTPIDPDPKGFPGWHSLGGKSKRTKRLRSKTPPGFAQAFFEANQ